MENKSKFKVVISDPYTVYQYDFELSENIAIFDLAEAIAKKFKVEVPTGQYIDEENPLSF